jgi:hypothetical protein
LILEFVQYDNHDFGDGATISSAGHKGNEVILFNLENPLQLQKFSSKPKMRNGSVRELLQKPASAL